MAGSFVRKTYQFDDYQSYAAIVVQPETLLFQAGFTSNYPAGQDYTQYPYLAARGARKGLRAVAGRIRFTWIDEAPGGYAPGGELQIPILLAFQRSVFLVGVEGVYQGKPVVITKVIPEYIP
jgi:hypothetical protein